MHAIHSTVWIYVLLLLLLSNVFGRWWLMWRRLGRWRNRCCRGWGWGGEVGWQAVKLECLEIRDLFQSLYHHHKQSITKLIITLNFIKSMLAYSSSDYGNKSYKPINNDKLFTRFSCYRMCTHLLPVFPSISRHHQARVSSSSYAIIISSSDAAQRKKRFFPRAHPCLSSPPKTIFLE